MLTRIAAALMLAAAPVFAVLGYVECSAGLQDPELEGGRTEFEFADINNDGNVDILSIGDHGSPYINTQEHGVMVWFGDGHGNWNVFQYGDFGYGGIAVGDVNWDGRWDVGYGMHHNYSGEDLGDDMLEVALGDGTGRMWTAWDDSLVPGGSVWGMFSTDFADVDNDGDLDVGSTSFGHGVGSRVFLNRGDGAWHMSFGTPGEINNNMEFYFRDVNADGSVDIVHAAAGPAVYFGDGSGGFFACDTGLPQSTYGLSGISPGDIDNDGGCDVAFANDNGGVEVWAWNDTVRRWQSRSNGLPASGVYEGTQLCDMDCDGFTDLCAFGRGLLTVWTGDGAGNWTQATSVSTPTPGYYQALRTGADFDHNGRPDIVLVSEEGPWPNEQNWAHAYRETTAARALSVFPVFPRGREKFLNGSVQFIDWWSAAPSAESTRVRLELSTTGSNGPWALVADTLRNGGRYQWLVPESVVSGDCYVRYTVTGPGGPVSAVTPRAFVIGDTTVGLAAQTRSLPWLVSTGPSPSRGLVQVHFGPIRAGGVVLSVTDALGRQILRRVVEGQGSTTVLDLHRCPSGTYFLRAESWSSVAQRMLVVRR
jgi:hypothetical protein